VYRSEPSRRAASGVFVATWLVHVVTIVREATVTGRFPLANMAEYLLVLGWIVMSLHLWLWFRLRVWVAGLVLAPLAGIMTFAASQVLSEDAAVAAVHPDGWFLFHTTVSTLGMATLCVAFAMSVLYLIQDRALKAKKGWKLLERLPSLQKADQIGHRALSVGFLLLTIGIGTGLVVNTEVYERLLVMGPKQVFPLLAWGVFAVILIARPLLGFRGRKSAYLTITGFALGLLTVVGMTL
jgi:ABC-type uncharacterized transport system permease subunit